jgi:hypothetical protein
MKTEKTKSYNAGFVLTEYELRKIHDLLIEQFQKKFTSLTDITERYEIKYKNGSVSEPNSLDAIFSQENIGSLAITRLKIKITDNNDPSLYEVTMQFTNLEVEEERGLKPISYTIIGNDNDWVFSVAFLLEERIKRIKRFSLISLSSKYNLLIVMLATWLLVFPIAYWQLSRRESRQLDKLKIIQESYKKGVFKDPIEVLIEIEKFKISEETEAALLIPPFMSVILIPIGISIILFLWEYFFPPYNLCWGEYVNFKKEREKRGKFIIVGVLFTLIISIVGNYISALLGIGK